MNLQRLFTHNIITFFFRKVRLYYDNIAWDVRRGKFILREGWAFVDDGFIYCIPTMIPYAIVFIGVICFGLYNYLCKVELFGWNHINSWYSLLLITPLLLAVFFAPAFLQED